MNTINTPSEGIARLHTSSSRYVLLRTWKKKGEDTYLYKISWYGSAEKHTDIQGSGEHNVRGLYFSHLIDLCLDFRILAS